VFLVLAFAAGSAADIPSSFDLRDVGPDHANYSTPVKDQRSGTCWAHGSLAALESNLLATGRWDAYVDLGIESDTVPNLNEYHLDWWNGFNWHNNDDTTPPQQDGNGIETHMGGDYLMTAAYTARGDGAVSKNDEPGDRDDQWFDNPPDRDAGNNRYYVRDITWQTVGTSGGPIDPTRMNALKTTIMEHGAVSTAMYWSAAFYRKGKHYQPPATIVEPNHSVAIIGWDDSIEIPGTPGNGAWLCKNSWSRYWSDDGHFWVSYYDKHAGYHPTVGAVSFQNVELNTYYNIYSHDVHGWRDTLSDVTIAMNAFTAKGDESLKSVSFYTAADNVFYSVGVFDAFSGGMVSGLMGSAAGTMRTAGFHTVDLETLIPLDGGADFYICLLLSSGGQAIDRTSKTLLLLGGSAVTDGTIVSDAAPGQSYYLDYSTTWPVFEDLYDLYIYADDVEREVTGSANFCIKALTVVPGDASCDGTVDSVDYEILRNSFGSGGDPRADFNGDGIVDIEDFAVLRTRFGAAPPPSGDQFAATTTPEPAALGLLVAGAAVLLKKRRKA